MTIQSDILFIPEDFSTSQLNKRTEYLVEYLKECSLIARELSIEFDREFPDAQISLKRSAQQLRWQWRGGSRRCFDPAAILAQDHAEHKEKIVSIETRTSPNQLCAVNRGSGASAVARIPPNRERSPRSGLKFCQCGISSRIDIPINPKYSNKR